MKPPRAKVPFIRKRLRNLPLNARRVAMHGILGSDEGATGVSPAITSVPWPLQGGFGVNAEREYVISGIGTGQGGTGMPTNVAQNMARHARAVRFFVPDTNDIGHGTGVNPLFPADPFANGNWQRVLTSIAHSIAAGMKVIYCIIPGSPGNQDAHLMAPSVRQAYWAAVSSYLAGIFSPDDLVLQPWNESAGGYSIAATNALAAEAYAVMRAAAPEHWIAISCRDSGRIWELENFELPANVSRVAVDVHDYDTTRTGDAGWYGKPYRIGQEIRRLSLAQNYTVPIFFGEIDMMDAANPTYGSGYAQDDPLRITELLTFQTACNTALSIHLTAGQIAEIGGVAALMWTWTERNSGVSRRINDPNTYDTADWRAPLNDAFFPPEAPAFTEPPQISGMAEENAVLSAIAGTVTGTAPITRAYQWLRNGVAIGGATAITYTLVTADVGAMIAVMETATNSAGNAAAPSLSIGPVTAAVAPPAPEPPSGAPVALVVRAIGPSHLVMWNNNGGAVAENGNNYVAALPGGLASKAGRTVWTEELQAVIPGLPITYAQNTQAGTGISHWATDSAITAACQTAIDGWITNATANPAAKCVFMIFCATQEWQFTTPSVSTDSWDARHQRVVEAALAQFDTAFPGRGDREAWVFVPGNRWNNDASSRWKILRLCNRVGVVASATYPPIAGFHGAFVRESFNVGDTNNTGDGIHYPIGQLHHFGAELAWAMMEKWGLNIPPKPTITNVWRSAAQQVRVRIRLGRDAGGDLISATGTPNPGLWAMWTGSQFVAPNVQAVDNTFKATTGHVEVQLNFSVNVPDTAALHFATEKFLNTTNTVSELVRYPHEVVAGGAGYVTTGWARLEQPRPIIRGVLPWYGPISTSVPANPPTLP